MIMTESCRHGLPVVESGPSCYYCALETKFNYLRAQNAADDSIEQVDSNAPEEWKIAALEAVQRVALTCFFFTTDDVWRSLMANGVLAPTEPRAMGAIMKRAANQGLCEITNQMQRSARVECHTRPLRLWRSLLKNKEHSGLF